MVVPIIIKVLKRYFSEVLATYGLIFFGTGAIIVNELTGLLTHPGVAVAWGLIVMIMIYGFGETSGAHINPAVTIAFWVAGRFPGKEVLPYILSQFIGAILASFSLALIFPDHLSLGGTQPAGSVMQTFILELILTFFLMLVVINVSTGSKEVGIFAGIAIGGLVFLEALVAGPITGASMNPIRSLSPALVSGNLKNVWIYLVSTPLGAILGIAAYKLLNK